MSTGNEIGMNRAKRYINGEINLSHGELNTLYTGLNNTREYIFRIIPGEISGTQGTKLVDDIDYVLDNLKKKGAKAIGKKKDIGIRGLRLYTDF
ncbi:MAG: hypothetical protein JW789_00780 [Candidatus Aenigmarchaeota archaeon]|nr:hypothetical protein [Candidatus Aenigmarchaeota archaeon]